MQQYLGGKLPMSYQKMRQSFYLKLPGKFHKKSCGKKKHDWYLEAGDEYLKRTSFNAVLKMLTRSDQKVLSLQVIMYKLFW